MRCAIKNNNHYSFVVLLCFLSLASSNYSQNLLYKNSFTEIDTLYFLPDSANFISQYLIANEVYNTHTRFEPPVGWEYYKIKEINFLFSTMVIGDTLIEVKYFKDTLNTLIYSQSVGVILDSNDVYPNWYKLIVSENLPSITGVIEIPVYVIGLFSLCITEQTFESGHTIGFFENSQDWGIASDYPIKLIIERNVTEIDRDNILINDYILYQNYPNPFNPTTKISYVLKQPGEVKLIVYDLSGREVKTLVNKFQNSGEYSFNFNGDALSSGVYFYKLKINNLYLTKKMILLQ